jgi:AraC-like DNA-binding protein
MYVVHGGALQLASSRIGTGDLVLLPSGGPHVMTDTEGTRPEPLADLDKRADKRGHFTRVHGPGPKTLVSAVPFAGSTGFPWLPRQIHVRSRDLDLISRSLVDAYTYALEQGEAEVLARIAEALWVKVIVTRMPRVERFDPEVLRAAVRVLDRPADRWTMRSLARIAGLSRSRFSARFTEALGEPPMRWVTRVRMRHADKLLTEGRSSVARVAEDLGFGDESSFRKTFRRMMGRAARSGGATL